MAEVFGLMTVHACEGYGPTLGAVEAGSLSAKPQGLRPRQEYAPSCAQKRSFRRAIRRALQHGFTWYKGQIFTPSQIDPAQIPPSCTPTKKIRPPPNIPNTKGHRYSCFSWNVGGLSLDTWDLLQQWIALQDLDIILLQETHWKHASQWIQTH